MNKWEQEVKGSHMDLSIIVPIFNTSIPQLGRCFASLSPAEGITAEVILVDDGSGEETASFCREAAKRHGFRYLRQKHLGVSAARNAGLETSEGRYVLFVDADDELIASNLKKQELDTTADILFYDFELMESGRSRKVALFDSPSCAALGRAELISAACHNRLNSACGKLFRREFLLDNRCGFDETMVFAEDAAFVLNAAAGANSACYRNKMLYRYHHDFKSGDRRLSSFPERVLRNSVHLYHLRQRTLDMPEIRSLFSEQELADLYLAVSDRLVRDLFEGVCSLHLLRRYDRELDQLILPLAAEVSRKYGDRFSRKTRLKCLLLRKNRGLLLSACGYLREIYIRIR